MKDNKTKITNNALPIVVKESANNSNPVKSQDTLYFESVMAEMSTKTSEEEKLQVLREKYEIKFPSEVITEDKDLLKKEDQKLFLEALDNSSFVLKEVSLSWAGKLFFAAAAAYIAGKVIKNMPLKISGTKQQLSAIADVIVASKTFQDELKRPGASIESVVKKLNLRNMTRDRFKQLTQKDFPI